MQSVDSSDMTWLASQFERAMRNIPRTKKELHEDLATFIKSVVDRKIDENLNDAHGKIRGWQQKFVGSFSGYAAVRASDKSAGSNSPGAITNYLENGHLTANNDDFVAGRNMYYYATLQVRREAQPLVEKFAEDLARSLGGSA